MQEARAKFWTKINASINEAKICELDAKRDAEESRRERELMDMDLEGRLDSLLGGWRDLMQRLREDKRKRDDSRDRAESLVRNIN